MISQSTLLCGGIWNTLGLRTRKVIGHFKPDFMGRPSRKTGDRGAEGELTVGDWLKRLQRSVLACGFETNLVIVW